MLHAKRQHDVKEYADLGVMCDKLINHSWCLCAGFKWKSITLLNDSTSEDALQEYAVIKNGRAIESLTVSWIKADKLAEYIQEYEANTHGADFGPVQPQSHPRDCDLCA